MADAFAQLGKIFTNPASAGGGANWGNIAKTGLSGFGLIGNILAQKKQEDALNRISYYQKNPAAAAAMVRSLTQPLSLGLTQDVGNNVQGYLAERGLNQSPNITAEVLSQSLAPYQQQNQQQALQEFYNLLNPAGATYGKPMDLTSLMSLFKPLPASSTPAPGTTAGTTPPTFPTDSFSYPGVDPNATYGSDSNIDPMAVYG